MTGKIGVDSIDARIENRDDDVGPARSHVPGLGRLDFREVPFAAGDDVWVIGHEGGPANEIALREFDARVVL